MGKDFYKEIKYKSCFYKKKKKKRKDEFLLRLKMGTVACEALDLEAGAGKDFEANLR